MIDPRTIDRIRERADIVDVVGDFVALKRRGREYIGLCPFHDDTRPSFHVSPTKNICKCFACNAGGTPVSFLEKYLHLSFPEAIKYLGEKYGIPVEEKQLTEEELQAKSEREELLAANAFARDAFVTELLNGNEGRLVGLQYFRDRGLTDETIKKFELGYSPRDRHFLHKLAEEKGLSPEVLERTGLLYRTDDGDYIDRYRDRVIYPIHSISGAVVGFGGRILVKKEHTGKYINSPASPIYDKSRELYGLYFAKQAIAKQDKCIVVEGYMDVLSMHQQGIANVVASSGTALTHHQVQMIRRFTGNLTFIFDADDAGISAALRALDIGLELGMNLHTVLLPQGEDPDSFARSHTAEEIEQYIDDHEEDSLRFNTRILLERNGADTPQGRAETVAAIAESMSHIREALTLDIYIDDIARQLGVEKQHLADHIRKLREQRHRTEQREQRRPTRYTEEPTWKEKETKKEEAKKEEALNPYEMSLLREILNHGLMEIPDFEIEPGRFGCSLIQAIRRETLDLRECGALSAPFGTILDEVERLYEEVPDADIAETLSWHPDPTILQAVSDLITDEMKLSDIHKTFVSEASTPTEVVDRVMKTILSYKYEVVLAQISSHLETLRSLPAGEVEGDGSERARELLGELTRLNQVKISMSKMLGDRILTPTSKLQPGYHS